MIPDILKKIDNKFLELINLQNSSMSGRVVVVVGSNACGKSLFRKAINQKLSENEDLFVTHFSQEGRSKGGFERIFLYGSESDESTGYLTVSSLIRNFNKDRNSPWVTICDEPEIGLSEESQSGLGIWLHDKMEKDTLSNLLGIVVITHSRHIVSALSKCKEFIFLDLDGLYSTHKEWLERKILPIRPETIKTKGLTRWKEFSQFFKQRKSIDSKQKQDRK